MSGCRLPQFVAFSEWRARLNDLFQVAVETLIRVEFRRIARQIRDFDLSLVHIQLLIDRFAVMHAEIVEHQNDLAARVLDQCLKELDQPRVVEVSDDDHPIGFSLVDHGRDDR